MTFPIISDQRIKSVPIIENGDPWIDLNDQKDLLLDHSSGQIQKLSIKPFLLRESVYLKLLEAQKTLPKGFKFQIKECYRPLWVQQKFYKDYFRFLKNKFTEYAVEQIEAEASKYLAPISVAPHSTGGAVDLILINNDHQPAEMGTEFNASPVKSGNKTYTDSLDISDQAKENRRVLKRAMQTAGFVNYPTERWHLCSSAMGKRLIIFMQQEFRSIESISMVDQISFQEQNFLTTQPGLMKNYLMKFPFV